MAMPRPVVDLSLSVKPCALYQAADSRTFPRIIIDPVDKEQPCTKVAEDDVLPESLAMGFVGVSVCALQRKFGVCPRELGLDINPALVPMNQRR
jgi:hypothetical protein